MKKGWETKKLGDIIRLEYGKPLPDTKRNSNGLFPIYGANGIKGRTNEYYYNKRTIIVGRKGSAGEVNLTENKFWPLDVTYYAKFDDNKYNIFFLYNLLSSLQLTKLAKGVKPGINRNEVYSIEVTIPSLSRQHQIVKILDESFSKINKAKENAEKNLKNARELFESYLENIFANPKKDWEGKKLREVCDIINGGTPDTKNDKFWGGNNHWITPKDLGKLDNIFVENTSRKITDEGLKNSSAKMLPINSIILSTRAPIGHLAINKMPISTNQGCRGLVPKKGINTLYIYYFLLKSNRLLESLGTGTTFKELSRSNLSEIEISVPPLKEQQEIVSKLDALSAECKKLEAIYQKKLDDLEELKKSILQKAFNGELT